MIFLRPWFLLLILCPFLFRMFREQRASSSDWSQIIDQKLLPYLLVPGTKKTAVRRTTFRTILWILLSVALAGPAWDKIEVPSETMKPATVIVAELGRMMSGSTLQREQQKISDTLDLLQGEQAALVLYDRFGYTAGPLTFELDIIRDMVPHLNAGLLPEKTINPVAGFRQAEKLLENAGIAQGRILFLTSGVLVPEELIDLAKSSPHRIAVLGIGPAEPHPIALPTGGFLTDQNGQTVMVDFKKQGLERLGAFSPVSSDDSDLNYLLDETEPDVSASERAQSQNIALWQDRGAWLVVLILPFFALLFRRPAALLGLLLLWSVSAEAGWWRRPDQEAYDHQVQAVRLYRNHRYNRAEKIFLNDKTAEGWYNAGNALAFQYKVDEAIDAYKKALALDPKHADAKYNKEYLERQKEPPEEPEKPQEPEQPENPEEPQEPEQPQEPEPPDRQDQPEEPPQEPEQPENSEQPEEPEQSENPEQPEQPEEPESQEQQEQPEDQPEQDQSGQQNAPEQEAQADQTEDQNKPQEQAPDEPLFDQESEQILNQLPSDEDRVLRYRIRKQYQRYLEQ